MSRFCVQAAWDDVPHLDEKTKADLLGSMPAHMRDARTKGIPSLGAGAIYPVPESLIVCEPFELPEYWPRAYGFDADWNRTAAIWGALDRGSDTIYLYSEHYQGQQPPSLHADAIKARGPWIVGAMDPSTNGKLNPKDGSRLSDAYRQLGLRLIEADNAVEAGIATCFQRFSAGRLKIFRTLLNTLAELRIYRRDEKGKVVKENDHLMDAMRYLLMTGIRHATAEPSQVGMKPIVHGAPLARDFRRR